MSIIEIHNDVRAVIADNGYAMLLITGTDKISSGFNNGDSILADIQHLIFGVADATERFPYASRLLLSNIANNLDKIPQDSTEWLCYVNKIYAKQEYHLKSTLSLIALNKYDNTTKAFIAHGGDSSLKIYNKNNGYLLYQTKVNMNFAGRSKNICSIDCVTINNQARVIVHSDGFNDVRRLCNFVVDDMVNGSLIDIMSLIIEKVNHIKDHEYDDISLLIVDIPEIYSINSKGILMSGFKKQHEGCMDETNTNDYDPLIKIM